MAWTTRMCIVAVSPLVQRRNTWSWDSDWKKAEKTPGLTKVGRERRMRSVRYRWKVNMRMDKFSQIKVPPSPISPTLATKDTQGKVKKAFYIHIHLALILCQHSVIFRSGNSWVRHDLYILSNPQRASLLLNLSSFFYLLKKCRKALTQLYTSSPSLLCLMRLM